MTGTYNTVWVENWIQRPLIALSTNNTSSQMVFVCSFSLEWYHMSIRQKCTNKLVILGFQNIANLLHVDWKIGSRMIGFLLSPGLSEERT